jgi:EAL domain-containing protein (putative c-di-GMP-specific phosphodiesterase class I)
VTEISFGNRLLLIDDEPALGRLVRRIAEQSEFEVIVADGPEHFLRTARLWRPNVVVMDLKMPSVDGIQLLRLLAADKCEADIIISSGSDARVLEAAMRLGHERGLRMSGMLQKPIRAEALTEMLAGFTRISKRTLAADLAKAIEGGELRLEYQPKLDLCRRRFTGVEALVRWQHPCHGLIRPDEFIALAEETGLINGLTDWVFRTAAAQAAAWQAEDLAIEVAVNLSANDMGDLDLPERLHRCCTEVGIDPEAVTLELTETGAMREAVLMMDILTRLRLKGFRLSIDDFGTGYSSLVQLQRLPFSEVKIDKSFVMQMARDNSCRVIAEIIIDLAHKLKLNTVAEGVEDEATLELLAAMGCDCAQGYHLSRPVKASDIPPFFRGTGNPRHTAAA